MKLLSLVLTSTLFASYQCIRYNCDNDFVEDQFCLITSIEAKTPACRMHFPVHSSIQLQFLQLEYLSASLLYRMLGVEKLDIYNSVVREAYVKPELEYFRISRSELGNLHIDKEEEYQLVELHLPDNQLSLLPKGLNRLVNLTMMDLSNNRLEYIDMGQFTGLNNLSILQLMYNNIKAVFTTGPVELVALKFFSLSQNDLSLLDISRWEMPLLLELDVSKNKLERIDQFPDKLPALLSASLKDNSWDCAWRDQVVMLFDDRNMSLSNGALEFLECYETAYSRTPSSFFKNEPKLKESLESMINNFVSNATGTSIWYDDIVEDIFCRMHGEE